MRKAKKQQGIKGVETGLRLAFVLAGLDGPAALKQIAQAAKLPPSKTHRYLVSLCRAGLAEQQPDGRYDLGPGAITLGHAAQSRLDAFRLVDAFIQHLFEETQLTVSVFAWGNRGPAVVRRMEPPSPVIVTTRIGSVISTVNSAAGRLFAAFLPKELADPVIGAELAAGVRSAATGLPMGRREFQEIVAEVRRQRIARVAGDFLAGFHAVSAPVFDASGQIVMAISLISPQGSAKADNEASVKLVATAKAFSRRLGYRGAEAA